MKRREGGWVWKETRGVWAPRLNEEITYLHIIHTEQETKHGSRKGRLPRKGFFRNTDISSETYRTRQSIQPKTEEVYHRKNGICKGPGAGVSGACLVKPEKPGSLEWGGWESPE